MYTLNSNKNSNIQLLGVQIKYYAPFDCSLKIHNDKVPKYQYVEAKCPLGILLFQPGEPRMVRYWYYDNQILYKGFTLDQSFFIIYVV